MDSRIFYPQPLIPTPAVGAPKASEGRQKAGSTDFAELLREKVSGAPLKFSKHAQERLRSRRIELDGRDLEKIQAAVEKAADKGAKESLLLMEDLALVVSINNRTVITAVDGKNIKDNIFTNIDSAVII